MDRVLITGGAGFIGNSIVDYLYKDYEIVILDNFSPQIHGNNYKSSFLYNNVKNKCRVIKGDIRSSENVRQSLEDVDYIIHLAAETGTGQSMYELSRYSDVNINGTSNLFEVIQKNNYKIKKIILSSSRAVYGEGMYSCTTHGVVVPETRRKEDMLKGDFEPKCPFCNAQIEPLKTTEDSILKPVSFYAYTKIAQEKMMDLMCQTLGIPYTIFRYQNVYGNGQSLENPYTGIFSIFTKQLLYDKEINIFEDGRESRDFIHVNDVARITGKALKCKGTDNECINIGSGENINVLEVAEILKECYGSKSKIMVTGDFRIGDIRHNTADIAKAKSLCGFKPEYSFREGIKLFTKWAESQNHRQSDCGYSNSIDEMKATGLFIQK